MSSTLWRRIGSLLVLLVLVTDGVASAQRPGIPSEWYQDVRRLGGDSITFCWWYQDSLGPLNRAVGEEIAALLLIEANFFEVTDFVVEEENDFWDAVFLAMVDDGCDAFMGMRYRDGYPEWLTGTLPYYQAGDVLAVTDPGFEQLADIPAGEFIGSQLAGVSDARLIRYIQTLPSDERLRRLPYYEAKMQLEHLLDGFIAGAVIWEPTLYRLTDFNPEEYGIHAVPLDPVPAVEIDVGMVLQSSDGYLRDMLDEAIAVFMEDGIVTDLLDSLGYPGSAADFGPD